MGVVLYDSYFGCIFSRFPVSFCELICSQVYIFDTSLRDNDNPNISRCLCGRLLQTSLYLQAGLGEHVLWYATPVAAGSMIIRILMNSETALVWVICVSLFLGISMEQVLSSACFHCFWRYCTPPVWHIQRIANILRAGFQTGLINAALALMIEVSLGQLSGGSGYRPLWEILAALAGDYLSFLALGAIPLFEAMGFVTDYRC